MTALPFLYVKDSARGGRGVFTARAIAAGDVVELAQVIVLSSADRRLVHQTSLHDYYFLWNDHQAAIALGYGSLYNHSPDPNLDYAMDYAFSSIKFSAKKNVAAGEELLIDYVAGDIREAPWFDVRP